MSQALENLAPLISRDSWQRISGEDVPDDFAMYIGEAELAALIFKGEAFMVESKLV